VLSRVGLLVRKLLAMDRAKLMLRWAWRFIKDIADEWSTDRVGAMSAEIAFFAVLGFFPALIVLAAALGSADGFLGESNAAEIETWLVDQMTQVFGGENTLESTVSDLFGGANTSAFTVGAVLGVYAASRGFVAVVGALDIAYDHEQTRGWLSTRLVGFGLTLLTVAVAAVVLTLLVVGPLFGGGAELAEDLGVEGWFTVLWTWFRWPVAFGRRASTTLRRTTDHRGSGSCRVLHLPRCGGRRCRSGSGNTWRRPHRGPMQCSACLAVRSVCSSGCT
jgi:uncharacterized BrkB/YihY/UPF0761 family membrane protein